MMNPPGSRPGMRSLATIPASKPITIVAMRLMTHPSGLVTELWEEQSLRPGAKALGAIRVPGAVRGTLWFQQTEDRMRTRLTRKLGIEHPIISAPMGHAAGGRLAAAV